MNCPRCNNGLYTTRMRKDRSGYPTFTLHCPEHGDIGEKGFKQGFLRTFFERPSRGSFIDDWNQLLLALVQEDRFNPTNWARLRLRAENRTLDVYLREVLESLANAEGAVSPGHIEMGTCGRCNGRALFNRGFRIRGRTSEWLSPGPPYIVDRLMNAINAAQEEPSW